MEGAPTLHEDERLLVLDKPAGRLVIPGRGEPSGPALVEEARAKLGRAFVVHRLDRETSGVLLLAKDAETHRILNALFEGRKVSKTYLALVRGRVEADGSIDEPLAEFGSGRVGAKAGGKPSRTSYRVRERFAAASLLEVEPHTGRRHQIRAHLYAAGHPVGGDPLYGPKDKAREYPRLMLHAWKLAFDAPWGGRLEFVAPVPADLEGVLARLRA